MRHELAKQQQQQQRKRIPNQRLQQLQQQQQLSEPALYTGSVQQLDPLRGSPDDDFQCECRFDEDNEHGVMNSDEMMDSIETAMLAATGLLDNARKSYSNDLHDSDSMCDENSNAQQPVASLAEASIQHRDFSPGSVEKRRAVKCEQSYEQLRQCQSRQQQRRLIIPKRLKSETTAQPQISSSSSSSSCHRRLSQRRSEDSTARACRRNQVQVDVGLNDSWSTESNEMIFLPTATVSRSAFDESAGADGGSDSGHQFNEQMNGDEYLELPNPGREGSTLTDEDGQSHSDQPQSFDGDNQRHQQQQQQPADGERRRLKPPVSMTIDRQVVRLSSGPNLCQQLDGVPEESDDEEADLAALMSQIHRIEKCQRRVETRATQRQPLETLCTSCSNCCAKKNGSSAKRHSPAASPESSMNLVMGTAVLCRPGSLPGIKIDGDVAKRFRCAHQNAEEDEPLSRLEFRRQAQRARTNRKTVSFGTQGESGPQPAKRTEASVAPMVVADLKSGSGSSSSTGYCAVQKSRQAKPPGCADDNEAESELLEFEMTHKDGQQKAGGMPPARQQQRQQQQPPPEPQPESLSNVTADPPQGINLAIGPVTVRENSPSGAALVASRFNLTADYDLPVQQQQQQLTLSDELEDLDGPSTGSKFRLANRHQSSKGGKRQLLQLYDTLRQSFHRRNASSTRPQTLRNHGRVDSSSSDGSNRRHRRANGNNCANSTLVDSSAPHRREKRARRQQQQQQQCSATSTGYGTWTEKRTAAAAAAAAVGSQLIDSSSAPTTTDLSMNSRDQTAKCEANCVVFQHPPEVSTAKQTAVGYCPYDTRSGSLCPSSLEGDCCVHSDDNLAFSWVSSLGNESNALNLSLSFDDGSFVESIASQNLSNKNRRRRKSRLAPAGEVIFQQLNTPEDRLSVFSSCALNSAQLVAGDTRPLVKPAKVKAFAAESFISKPIILPMSSDLSSATDGEDETVEAEHHRLIQADERTDSGSASDQPFLMLEALSCGHDGRNCLEIRKRLQPMSATPTQSPRQPASSLSRSSNAAVVSQVSSPTPDEAGEVDPASLKELMETMLIDQSDGITLTKALMNGLMYNVESLRSTLTAALMLLRNRRSYSGPLKQAIGNANTLDSLIRQLQDQQRSRNRNRSLRRRRLLQQQKQQQRLFSADIEGTTEEDEREERSSNASAMDSIQQYLRYRQRTRRGRPIEHQAYSLPLCRVQCHAMSHYTIGEQFLEPSLEQRSYLECRPVTTRVVLNEASKSMSQSQGHRLHRSSD